MNTMNVRDTNSNEDVPWNSTSYGSNNIGNVQVPCHDHLEFATVVDIEVFDDAYITEMHLEDLRNQWLFWEPNYHTLFMSAF